MYSYFLIKYLKVKKTGKVYLHKNINQHGTATGGKRWTDCIYVG